MISLALEQVGSIHVLHLGLRNILLCWGLIAEFCLSKEIGVLVV